MEKRPKSILLVSDPELGQLNVQLSTSYALLTLYPDLQVHFASSPAAEGHIAGISEQALKKCPPGRSPIQFHALQTPDIPQVFETLPQDVKDHFANRMTLTNCFAQSRRYFSLALPFTKEVYEQGYLEIKQLLKELEPDVVAVDPLMSAAICAMRDAGVNFHLLMPTPIREAYTGIDQLWTFPVGGTAWPFPLPWYLVPFNIIIFLCQMLQVQFGSTFRDLRPYIREKLGIEPVIVYSQVLQKPPPGLKALVPAIPEMDLPVAEIPKYTVTCGPILRPFDNIADVDPQLDAWLAEGPTVLVNLGSHRVYDEERAVEMAGALKLMLDMAAVAAKEQGRPELAKLRVLWKMNKTGRKFLRVGTNLPAEDPESRDRKVHDILGDEIDADRVRITTWLTTEPTAILQSGHIVCSVHHGGANSAIETIAAGVPHVILPAWIDCYDWAIRVEYLGIGKWGSRQGNPGWKAKELGQVLLATICGPEAESLRSKATSLKLIIDKRRPGSEVAATELMNTAA